MQETPLPEIFDSRDEPAAAGAPAVQPPAASTAVAKVDLLALAISRFGEWRAGAAALVERYRAVAFDLSTATGYAELTKAIAEVRAPRYAAQNVAKASKSELAVISKAVGAEEAAVTAFLDATEKRLVALRDAHDAKVAADKAGAARIEAERKAEAARLTAQQADQERVAAEQALAAKQLADQRAELASQREALAAQARALRATEVALAEMVRKASDVEAKRQADEADEAEKARKEAEAEAQRIAAEEQWAREQEAARIAVDQEAQRRHDAAEQVLLARIKSIDALAASNQAALAASPAQPAAPVILPMPPAIARASVPANAEPATLTLGMICERLSGGRPGFNVSGAFLAEALHVRPASKADGRPGLYSESQYQTICRQFLAHIGAMAELHEGKND